MRQIRVTKYNPLNRNSDGHYLDQNEWTCFSEVGGKVSLAEYEAVESAYIGSAVKLLSDSGIQSLNLISIEDSNQCCHFSEGDIIDLEKVESVLRSVLRNEYWCKIESNLAFIHVGWDYYMYVGVTSVSDHIKQDIVNLGLYVEDVDSPYLNQLD